MTLETIVYVLVEIFRFQRLLFVICISSIHLEIHFLWTFEAIFVLFCLFTFLFWPNHTSNFHVIIKMMVFAFLIGWLFALSWGSINVLFSWMTVVFFMDVPICIEQRKQLAARNQKIVKKRLKFMIYLFGNKHRTRCLHAFCWKIKNFFSTKCPTETNQMLFSARKKINLRIRS